MSKLSPSEVADRWEELVNTPGATKLISLDKSKHHPTTLFFLSWYEKAQLEVQQVVLADGTDHVGNTVLFYTGHALAPYFHHDPLRGQHQWAFEDFHEACNRAQANEVIADLLHRGGGPPSAESIPVFKQLDRAFIEADSTFPIGAANPLQPYAPCMSLIGWAVDTIESPVKPPSLVTDSG